MTRFLARIMHTAFGLLTVWLAVKMVEVIFVRIQADIAPLLRALGGD